MLNSKKNFSKSSYYNSKLLMTKKLTNFEINKEHTQQNYNIKKFEPKRIKIIYRPLHKENKFNSSSMGINEIVKKKNLPLITNDTIKNLIIKFRNEREKEMNEKRVFYRESSYQDIQREKNTQFLMLRAMLRRDPLTIQSLMNRNKRKQTKIKKSVSMKYLIRDKINYDKKKFFNKTTDDTIASEKYQNNNSSNNYENSKIFDNNKFKKEVWKNDFLLKKINYKNSRLKKYEIKIRSVNSLMLPGRLSPFKYSINYSNKKFNQDCIMMNPSLISAKLDEISLFGIFDGNGHHGKGIAQAFKNYVLDYFKNGNEMKVTLKKDNFYSILYNSFVYAQNYLKNNSSKLNINMNFSGSTGIIVLYPHNCSNKVYCANIGRNKCMFYSMLGPIKLSYELYPNRASEKDRISIFKEKLKEKEREKEEELKKKKEKEKENEETNNNNNKENSENNNDTKNKNTLMDKKRKEAFIKEFSELDISRCVGNLAAEELGIIPGPEIGESDIRINKGKFIVIGTESLWKYISENEVCDIVSTHYFTYNSEAACQDLIDLAKDRWKEKNDGAYDDISVIVLFFDAKNL